MNQREIDAACQQHLRDSAYFVDRRPFWLRLLASIRIKISGTPPNKIEVTGKADF